jgi:hypothetical protein
VIRAVRPALLIVLAAAAAGCGSDLGPGSTPAAAPLRIQLVHGTAALAVGVHDAITMLGGRVVHDTSQADLVVTADPAAAAAAARANGGTHILIVDAQPRGTLAPNVRVVGFDRAGMAYLAGAVAALEGGAVAVAEPGGELAPAFRAGAAAVGGRQAPSVGCGAQTGAAVVYVPDPACRPGSGSAQIIAPHRLAGARMLAVLETRPAVVVTETARSVQDGIFQPGVAVAGLRQDAIGFAWISPAVPAATVDRLQHIEDDVRAETAPVPSLAP